MTKHRITLHKTGYKIGKRAIIGNISVRLTDTHTHNIGTRLYDASPVAGSGNL